jgi:Tfp pilus assembly PilM family ATPase
LQRCFAIPRQRYPNWRLHRLLLCGGHARIRGLDDYMSVRLNGIEVILAQPKHMLSIADNIPPDSISPALATAIGLAQWRQ